MEEEPRRMHPRIRAPATDGIHLVLVQSELQCALHFRLHAGRIGLALPASVRRAVVCDLQEVAR